MYSLPDNPKSVSPFMSTSSGVRDTNFILKKKSILGHDA